MQSASAVVPTQKPQFAMLEEAVQALLWTMPQADFYISIDSKGTTVAVSDAEGNEHVAKAPHTQLVAHAVREAMLKAFNVQPAGGWVRTERIETLGLTQAFSNARSWLPGDVISVGRRGDVVWASSLEETFATVQPVHFDPDDKNRVELDAKRRSLAEAVIAASAIAAHHENYENGRRLVLVLSDPEVREAA